MTSPLQADIEVQQAIYRAALSLESFLLNGILFGILSPFGPGFLDARAADLRRDLTALEAQTSVEAADLLLALQTTAERLVSHVTDLSTFRTRSLDEVCSVVARIVALRHECVNWVEQLESALDTPSPFYASRPANSVATVNAFLEDLEKVFEMEWTAANPVLSSAEGHP